MARAARANTFEAVAREWLPMQKERLAPATYAKAEWTLETLVFPHLGTRPIDKISAADVLKVLKRIEGRGLHETAHRARQRISQVCRYAVVTERAQHDVTLNLHGALAPVVTTNHAAITEPAKIGELRHAEWSEFDLDRDDPQWRIPAAKMKMREQHIVSDHGGMMSALALTMGSMLLTALLTLPFLRSPSVGVPQAVSMS
jgi:integrase